MKKILTTGLTDNTQVQFEKNLKLVEPDICITHVEYPANFVKKVKEESPDILVIRLVNEKNELIDSIRQIKSDTLSEPISIVILFDENDFIGNPDELLKSCDGLLSLPVKKWEVLSLFRLLIRDKQKKDINPALTNVSDNGNKQVNLKSGEEQFRSIIEGAPDPIIIQTEMKFAYLNNAACRLFGISFASELIDKPVMERFHPDFHEKIKSRIHHLNDLKQSVTDLFEQKFIRMDGSEVWVETAGEPISYKGKNGALVFVRDISKRKESEKALMESENRFRSTLDSMLEGCQIIGFDWNYIYLNEAAVKQSHHKKDDLTGKNFAELWPGIEKSELFKKMKRCLKKRVSVHMENLFNYPDGSEGWFELSIQPVPEGIFILSMDITERKMVEKKLHESEERYRLILDNSLDAVLLTSPDGSVYSANKAACEMFDMTEEEICRAARNGLVDLEDPNLPRLLEERERTGKAKGELRFVRKNGSVFSSEISASLFYNSRGEMRNSMVIRDISERKKSENILQELKNNLEIEVVQKTKELRERISELERFQNATIEREFRIKELRDEIDKLKK